MWINGFCKTWRREEARLAYRWNVEDFEETERPRPEFEGPKARDELFPIEAWQHKKFETPYPGFVSEGDVTVSSAHGNPIGAMHGGAQVMSSPEELDRFGLCKSNLIVRR